MSENSESRVIRIGSRRSQLALKQTNHVRALLKNLYPDVTFVTVIMSTGGDRVLNISLPKIGEKSLFTKDLEESLRNGSLDMVVHSLKDLPTTLPDNLAIGAVLEREDPRDALVLRSDLQGHTLDTLPPGSIIGTSSLRRTAQILCNYPHLKVADVRGNVNTRLSKLDGLYSTLTASANKHAESEEQKNGCNHQSNGQNSEVGAGDGTLSNGNGTQQQSSNGQVNETSKCANGSIPKYSALILAHAGLIRIGLQHRVSQILPCNKILYAVGQGALAIECRADNYDVLQMLAPLNDPDTYCRILAERSFLKTLGGGCSTPVAISTSLKDIENSTADYSKKKLNIKGAIWSLNGQIHMEEALTETLESNDKTLCSASCDNKATKHKADEKEQSTEESCRKVMKLDENSSKKTCPYKTEADSPESNKTQCPSMSMSVGEMEDLHNSNCCKMRAVNVTTEKEEPIEIENLIEIHGSIFKLCPHSKGFNGVCPAKFSVGEEVMGQCPYLSQADDEFRSALVKLHRRKVIYDVDKCPFMSNKVVSVSVNTSNSSDEKIIEVMPYDVDNEHKYHSEGCNAKLCQSKRCFGTELHCGMTKHFYLSDIIINKCEDLGKNLASKLIERGALEVMHDAQEHIKSSVSHSVLAQ